MNTRKGKKMMMRKRKKKKGTSRLLESKVDLGRKHPVDRSFLGVAGFSRFPPVERS